MNQQDTVLIIEDDKHIADVVALNIHDLGLKTEYAPDGQKGLEKALNGTYVMVILDLMLPGMDGLSVCRHIREKNSVIPLLMLTAKSSEIDRIIGLEIGADDYMTKPFSVRELVARVKALLRRATTTKELSARGPGEQNIITYAGFTLDREKRKILRDDKKLDLTVKEFDLLALFLLNPGRTYSRTDLLSHIWGYQYAGYEHTVNSHINRLRMKIEDNPGHPRFLKTVWGIGYRFAEEDELSP